MDRKLKDDLTFNWHPYTQMKDHESLPPLFIESAKGIKLFAEDGNWYYDTISSWWCNVHGHCHPAITKAVSRQIRELDHVLFAGFTHAPAIELSKKLVSLAPRGLKRVFYSDDGSTAVETALKMSFQYWKNTGVKTRNRFVALNIAYHGDTFGSMSVSGVDLYNKTFSPLFFKSYKVPAPYCYRCFLGLKRPSCGIACLGPLEKLLKEKNAEIAAMIIEPMVLAASGMIVYPKEYLYGAAKLAKKYGAHFIADEVAVGFGRTGKMFACEHAGVSPDLMCLSKGLTGGTIALGATLANGKIYDAFYADYDKRKTFYHGHTFTANPVACSAALASLKVFEQERTLLNASRISSVLAEAAADFADMPFAGDVRQIGTIFAVELVADKKSRRGFEFSDRIGARIYTCGLKRNLILRPLGNIIYLYLPLSTGMRELKYILSATYDSIWEAMREHGF